MAYALYNIQIAIIHKILPPWFVECFNFALKRLFKKEKTDDKNNKRYCLKEYKRRLYIKFNSKSFFFIKKNNYIQS